jgi:hypothetical protein
MSKLSRGVLVPCALLLGGCLVQEPPDLTDAEQTRPFALVRLVTPSPEVVQIIVLDSTQATTFPFSVPIQSEDRGEAVKGALHFDLGADAEDFVAAALLQPSTFLAGPRTAEFAWDVRARHVGCHRLTAVFAHQNNFDESTQLVTNTPEAAADSESISWLVNVSIQGSGIDPSILVDCPRKETVQLD